MTKLDKAFILGSIICYMTFTSLALAHRAPDPYASKLSFNVIKDPDTKCQYIISGNAMYPRLDERRNHICSDTKHYYFNPKAEGEY